LCYLSNCHIINLIKMFNSYALKDGDQFKIIKKDVKAMMQTEFPSFFTVIFFSLTFLNSLHTIVNDELCVTVFSEYFYIVIFINVFKG
uniref:S100/CaBP-9k-type calcium binding subdomain domain-containing protein n=1 Tax=Seriola lalandi dorsalis TaxID=1841481 RepID=A0A3B4XL82_SERLL